MSPEEDSELPSPDGLQEQVRRLNEHFGRLTRVMEAMGFVIPDSAYDRLDLARPRLHQQYTEDEGAAAFAEGPAEWLCGGQFGVLPAGVLGFFTLSGSESGPAVASPTRVTWRPGRPDYAPGDEHPWLPRAVLEPLDSTRERRPEYHLFLRRSGEDRYLYAGRARLDSWSDWAGPRADFALLAKLPREAWDRLGGYPGWLVTVGEHSERLAADDHTNFERIVSQLPPEAGAVSLTRYEQDGLSVVLNADRGLVWYSGPDAEVSDHAIEPGLLGRADEDVWFQNGGEPYDVLRGDTVPRQMAIAAAVEFFRTGRRPECVSWPEPPAAPADAPPPDGTPRIGYVTESEWHTGTDPEWLLQSLHRAPEMDWLAGVDIHQPERPVRRLLDDRKLRLLAAACCRRVWHLMTDERSRRVVEVFERHTDGRATEEEWAAAGSAAHAAWTDTSRLWPAEAEAAGEAVARAALHATTTAAAQLAPGVLRAQPGMWAFAVACSVLIETARAVAPNYPSSSERGPQCDLIRDVFGNPFRPVTVRTEWLTPTVVALAHGIDEEGAFERLPVLADALEEAGCEDADVLRHCRSETPHVRGCWVIDLLLPGGPRRDEL